MTFEYPFAPHFLDLGGVRCHYIDEGPRDRATGDATCEPVLMVHGNPSWSFLYRKLVRELAASHRCIVPDHVGCGRSDKPADADYDYTLERRVADLTALVDRLELPRVSLVVHDWGGMIGSAWAVRNPSRVARMVVFNTGAFPLPAAKKVPLPLRLARTPGLGALLVRGLNAFARGATRRCVTRRPMSAEVAAGFCEPYDSWAHRIAVHRFVQDIPLAPTDRAFALVQSTADGLARLRHVPMLLCWGMRDFVFDRHFLDEWIRRFPDAAVHRFEDAGHYVLEDAFDEILPLVRECLARQPGEPSPAAR